MRGLVLLCASQRWRDNNQSEARLSSGRQWPGLMAGTPEWHPVTWSYTTVTNKHCHCHSTHYLSYTPDTSRHSKHILTSDQTQIITQQIQKVSQLVLSELFPLLESIICLKTYLALSKLYVSLTAGWCSILPVTIWWEMRCVRLCDTRNLWLRWPASPGHWLLTLLTSVACGHQMITRGCGTQKTMRASWAFSVFSAKVMFPWSSSEWDILHVNVVGGAGQRWALHGALKTIPRHYNRRG